ncbi:MAG: hypothetical protein U0231_14480 [Nitrospiraceae bacterium]
MRSESVLFWWILFVVLQVAERLFLLRDAWTETPTVPLLLHTFVVGLRGDFISATSALVLALIRPVWRHWPVWGWQRVRGTVAAPARLFQRALQPACVSLALLLLILLCVDMGYYTFNRQHMDFVFLEYVGDLLTSPPTSETNDQAAKQTGAELGEGAKWAVRVSSFFLLQGIAVGLWWWLFRRRSDPPSFAGVRRRVSGERLALRRVGRRRRRVSPYRLRNPHRAHRQFRLLHAGTESAPLCG